MDNFFTLPTCVFLTSGFLTVYLEANYDNWTFCRAMLLQIFRGSKVSAKGLTVKLTEDPPGGSEMLSPDMPLMLPGEDIDSQCKLPMLALTIKR